MPKSLLETKTQLYWRLSKIWYDRSPDDSITVLDGLNLMNTIILEVPTYHKLYTLAVQLRDDMIHKDIKRKPKLIKS